jgi:Ni/Co efflux regulator RcnB
MFAMKRFLLGTIAAAIVAFTLTLPAAGESDQHPSREERIRDRAADRETMLHAKLAGMGSVANLAGGGIPGIWTPVG